MEIKKEIIIRENSKIKPNGFGIRFENEKGENNFLLTFGNTEDNKIEIMSEVELDESGFKVVLKRMIDIAYDFERKTGIDILGQILEESEEEGV